MKKLFILTLLFCLMIGCCFSFASCAGVNATTVDKDTYTSLSEAQEKTFKEFFADEIGANAIIKKALKNGSMTVDFECDEQNLGQNVDATSTLYFNDVDKKYVSDTTITIDQSTLNTRLFVDKNGIIINSPALVGSDNTYAINFGNLVTNFSQSALKDLLVDPEDPSSEAKILDALTQIKEEYEALFDKDFKQNLTDDVNAYLALMNKSVTEEKLPNADGKDVNCVVINYSLSNDILKAIFDKVYADFEGSVDTKQQLRTSIDELLQKVNEVMTFEATFKTYIAKNNGQLVQQTVDITITALRPAPEENVVSTITFGMSYGADKILLTGKIKSINMDYTFDVNLTKTKGVDTTTYQLAVNFGDGKGASVNYLNETYTYTKSTGAFVMVFDMYDEEERDLLTFAGKITKAQDSVRIEINSITIEEESINFVFAITFNTTAQMPQAPTDAKDVSTLTAEELQQAIQDLMENSIFNMLMDKKQ